MWRNHTRIIWEWKRFEHNVGQKEWQSRIIYSSIFYWKNPDYIKPIGHSVYGHLVFRVLCAFRLVWNCTQNAMFNFISQEYQVTFNGFRFPCRVLDYYTINVWTRGQGWREIEREGENVSTALLFLSIINILTLWRALLNANGLLPLAARPKWQVMEMIYTTESHWQCRRLWNFQHTI